MPWEIETWQNEKLIYLKASGSMSLDSIKQMCSETIAEANKQGLTKYLVDFRDMVPDIEIINIYSLPEILEELGDNRLSKTAMVFSQDSKEKEKFSFFQTVSFNRGFNVRLFTKIDEARKWLC